MEEDFLDMIDGREFDLVVCSDAEAILGIGDQGVGVSSVPLVRFIRCTNTAAIGYGCAYRSISPAMWCEDYPSRYPRPRQLFTGKGGIAHAAAMVVTKLQPRWRNRSSQNSCRHP